MYAIDVFQFNSPINIGGLFDTTSFSIVSKLTKLTHWQRVISAETRFGDHIQNGDVSKRIVFLVDETLEILFAEGFMQFLLLLEMFERIAFGAGRRRGRR